jgi:predicted TIM-barrel fold metal-dependent hydrolase
MTDKPQEQTATSTASKTPIINCHTHIFTGDHVAPWLAKTFVPMFLFWLFPLWAFVWLFRKWYKYPAKIPYTGLYKKWREHYMSLQSLLDKLGFFRAILEYAITIQVFFILYDLIKPIFPPDKTWISGWIADAQIWLTDHSLLWSPSFWIKVLVTVIVFIIFPSGRNLIIFVFRNLWSILKKIPGKQTNEMFRRYLTIGRFSFHEDQRTILFQLRSQYPIGSGLVVLPMDMEFMKAGKTPVRYRDQMQRLAELKDIKDNKDILFPFVFVDPRRMVPRDEEKRIKDNEPVFFDYEVKEGKVKLKPCFIKDYIETKGFSGFKIYPALGYYPFEHRLLPLWKYAVENNIPIMTHCVRGPMFYRGSKKDEWNHHPYFKQAMGTDEKRNDEKEIDWKNIDSEDPSMPVKDSGYEPLALPQQENAVFTANFTHPLNFLCLLEEEVLRKVVADAVAKAESHEEPDKKDFRLRQLFGFTNEETRLGSDLRELKICLGHYGGGDEWIRYFENDRYGHSNRLTKDPKGIDFFKTTKGKPSKGKIEQLWKYTDWYSIISSMILRYPKVYADISYILHDNAGILPLLKQTLLRDCLKEKVLYGTDFYVVRNHKSDKNMLADMMGGLSVDDFDQIARKNPLVYLNIPVPPAVISTPVEC